MSLTVSSIANSALDYSTLFPSSSSGTSGDTLLADYAAIKNGSLKKLYKAYYSGLEEQEAEASSEAYSTVKANASKLSDSIKDLQSESLYDGESTDDLYEAVSDYIKNYNSTLTSSASESTTATNSMALKLASTTSTYSEQFSSIGISINEDGTLSIDEDEFKEAVSESAGLSTAKDLFGSSYGYSNIISTKASIIESIAGNRINSSGSTGTTYGSGGSSSSVLDSLIDVDA